MMFVQKLEDFSFHAAGQKPGNCRRTVTGKTRAIDSCWIMIRKGKCIHRLYEMRGVHTVYSRFLKQCVYKNATESTGRT